MFFFCFFLAIIPLSYSKFSAYWHKKQFIVHSIPPVALLIVLYVHDPEKLENYDVDDFVSERLIHLEPGERRIIQEKLRSVQPDAEVQERNESRFYNLQQELKSIKSKFEKIPDDPQTDTPQILKELEKKVQNLEKLLELSNKNGNFALFHSDPLYLKVESSLFLVFHHSAK